MHWREYPRSKLAPPLMELEYLETLCRVLRQNLRRPPNVLEFGCGVTSAILRQELKPLRFHMVEDYEPNIRAYADLGEIHGDMSLIGENIYDVILIDSSAGSGKTRGYHRHENLLWAMPRAWRWGHYIIIHDWRRVGGRECRRILESDPSYALKYSYDRHNGWGVYFGRTDA